MQTKLAFGLAALASWLVASAQAQVRHVTRVSEHYAVAQVEVAPGQVLPLEFDFPVTGVVVEAAQLAGATLTAAAPVALVPDPHQTGPVPRSQLLVTEPRRSFTLAVGEQPGPVRLHLLYAPPLPPEACWWERRPPLALRLENGCERPQTVPQSEWRAGLTPPRTAPTATAVRFIIVHHEAGSNNPVNFTQTVRNIYLLHTQTNGWADIGYNFVVAQNGTIFDGRDGQGRLDGDNVLGAHFCGKNANTMGICLLGNYMTAEPTSAALASLARVISWKLAKENLTNPFGRGIHLPGSAEQSTLNVISGHRDGCATDCPGDNVYRRLAEVRQSTLAVCNVLADDPVVFTRQLSLYPVPARQRLTVDFAGLAVRQLALVTANGQPLQAWAVPPGQASLDLDLAALPAGLYLLQVETPDGPRSKKLVIE
ncbi:MAG: N-acetylmuramoyl-L-alanine amidase [Bernardetiaceae bacterium]|nr:N-acetylmuramoyl-L-alanine amidase [Bernardetiaceae bacterium]